MGTLFPYGICRLCGSDPPINGVDALLMPSFIDLTYCLLGIKIRDVDKCSKLVCKSCVNTIRNFGVFASTIKSTQVIIEQFISFNEQENQAAESELKLRDDNVFLVSDESSEDEPLSQLVRSSSALSHSAVAVPMVVIPSDKRSDRLKSPSESKNASSQLKISPKTSYTFEPKRRKTISTNIPQDYTFLKTKCVSCSVFVKTVFEQDFHKSVHKNGTCVYCMEEIKGGSDMTYHFLHCFLTQCHIVDVLSCYMKNCSVRVDTAIENSANFTQMPGQAEAVPRSVVSRPLPKRPKHEVGDTLLISKKHVELLGKQNIALKSNAQYIPVTLVSSTDSQKCTFAAVEVSRSSVRHRLKKEKIAQQYGNFKFLSNVQKIHALKAGNREKPLTLPPIAAFAESNNGIDIINSEAAHSRAITTIICPDTSLLAEDHNRKPSTNESGGIVTKANHTQLPTSCIDLLTDSSDDETFPSFVKPTNAVVKQYKGISNSNELKSYSKPMQVTQNVGNSIYCSNAPSTSQLSTTLEIPFPITPSYMPVMRNTNPPVPPLSAITNEICDSNSLSIPPLNSTTYFPTHAGVHTSDAEVVSGKKYRNIQPKPSKPIQNRLYNSMLLNISPSIFKTNSALPNVSAQTWHPQQFTLSTPTEPLVSKTRPVNDPKKIVARNLDFGHQKDVIVDMPKNQHSLDRLHILSPQDINNRIS